MSKESWTTTSTDNSTIQTSALMRIADAAEVMAESNAKLKRDFESMESSRDYYENAYYSALKSIASYKGQITKLKKKLQP
jgi:hypothetical protein